MIDSILKERNARYGDFATDAHIAQAIKAVVNAHVSSNNDVVREALDHIATKLARIANGDPHYADNWRDIIGYCTLVLRELGED